jgi:hypothetical protein
MRRRFLRRRRPAARTRSPLRDGLPAEFIIVCAEANEQDLLPQRAELPDRVGRRIGADFGVGQRKSPWLMGQGLSMNAGCEGSIPALLAGPKMQTLMAKPSSRGQPIVGARPQERGAPEPIDNS